MKKIKILHVITGLEGGGAARSLVELIRKMDRDRFEISVCSLRPATRLSEEIRKAGIALFHPRHLKDSLSFLRDAEADLIHSHLFHADLIGCLSRKKGRPLVSTRHTLWEGGERGFLPRFLYRFMTRRMSRVVAVSGKVEKHLIESIGVEPEKVHLILHGIDLERYHPQDPFLLRERIGLENGHPVIGTACRFVPEKGLETLIRAMGHVRRSNPAVRCLIAGAAPRGGGMPVLLREQVRRLGLEREILFVGWQEDISLFLSGLDLFILPSHVESFGRVLLEAMALKRGIVATQVGGVVEIIEGEKEGLLVPPNEEGALAEAILHLLGNRPERERLGQQAFEKVQKHFSLDRTVHQLSGLYESLLYGN